MALKPRTAILFLKAVHRRMIFVRSLEQLGRGLLLASIFAIVLSCIAISQSMPTQPILLICGLLGVLIGGVLSVTHWPTFLQSASEADRQLRMDDLLTTAVFMAQDGSEDFVKTVIAITDARCRHFLPSDVVLRKFGIRSWSAVFLAIGIAVTIAIIPTSTSRSLAKDSDIAVLTGESPQIPLVSSLQSSGGATPTNDGASESASKNAITADAQDAREIKNRDGKPGTKGAPGSGGGSASTPVTLSNDPQFLQAVGQTQDLGGTTAGGGDSHEAKQGGLDAGGQRTGSKASGPDVSAWTGDMTKPPEPGGIVNESRIPLPDRDLVHAFFSRK